MVTIGIFLNPAATPACHLLCFLPVPSLAIASTTTLCLSLSSTIGIVLSAGSTIGSAETRSPEYTTFGPSALRVKDTLHKVHPSLSVSYTHLRAHETRHDLVCRLLLEKKKK